MRRSIAAVAAGVLVGVVAIGVTAAVAGPKTLSTTMSGQEETGAKDPNATGFATVTLSAPGQREICVTLSWQNVSGEDTNSTNDAVTMAHIHEGDAGVAGPIVHTIFMNQSLPTTQSATEYCAAATPALIRAIRKDPTHYYVNVHSGEYPAGAVRGQLGD